MAPWLPRLHLFEFHDQPWFHPWFRAKVQAALTETWLMTIWPLQSESPASIVARQLADELRRDGSRAKQQQHVVVDYCAGGGGPIPMIAKHINKDLQHQQPVHFVLTDLHPHIHNWALAAAASPHIHYAPSSVDAANSPPGLLDLVEPPLPPELAGKRTGSSADAGVQAPRIFRTFHLSFHHFDDPLALAILRDTMNTSAGFAIVELQDRHLTSFLAIFLLGIGVMVFSPIFAWRWRSPGTFFWSWIIPVLPFVLVWDGWMSSARSRTRLEVEDLMRRCGASEDEVKKWHVKSGKKTHLPPWADVHWIIGTREGDE
ncbi:hypothetical protein BD289DRAFT_438942 [Coniella lustricola]|uniref:S-adenosyl-L-methionine-dependent methyltransferase n=1 Tax=Coniella lustricola TaxID=2025994 RepID=A0A2T3A2E1_9PEZI|nr:hypothetical protein BD289DRAFT_438942 [Coniella lustricola]